MAADDIIYFKRRGHFNSSDHNIEQKEEIHFIGGIKYELGD